MSRIKRTKQFRDKVNEEYFNKIMNYVNRYSHKVNIQKLYINYGFSRPDHHKHFCKDFPQKIYKRQYKKIGKWPGGLQVLCHNCNRTKR